MILILMMVLMMMVCDDGDTGEHGDKSGDGL